MRFTVFSPSAALRDRSELVTDRDENVSLVCLCAVVFKPGRQFAPQVI